MYKKSDWDIISFITKDKEIIDADHRHFPDWIKAHKNWVVSHTLMQDKSVTIYSIKSNVYCPTGIGYESQILTVGDTIGNTYLGSDPKERNLGKICGFWANGAQMIIEQKHGGMPISNLIGKIKNSKVKLKHIQVK